VERYEDVGDGRISYKGAVILTCFKIQFVHAFLQEWIPRTKKLNRFFLTLSFSISDTGYRIFISKYTKRPLIEDNVLAFSN
jgi:hypothetical protein